jgi:hypothetical protein
MRGDFVPEREIRNRSPKYSGRALFECPGSSCRSGAKRAWVTARVTSFAVVPNAVNHSPFTDSSIPSLATKLSLYSNHLRIDLAADNHTDEPHCDSSRACRPFASHPSMAAAASPTDHGWNSCVKWRGRHHRVCTLLLKRNAQRMEVSLASHTDRTSVVASPLLG